MADSGRPTATTPRCWGAWSWNVAVPCTTESTSRSATGPDDRGEHPPWASADAEPDEDEHEDPDEGCQRSAVDVPNGDRSATGDEKRATPLAREPISRTMPTVRLTIDGMMCDGCASRVEENVGELEGVQRVDADHEEGTAAVDVQAGTSDADRIRDSVEQLGYDVTGLQGT
jgi:copper chaperone CopZ